MLAICLIIAFVLIGAVLLRFAEGDEPGGNGTSHHQDGTGEPDGEEPGELAVAA
jgi:preprotein translocase subunit SecG